MRSLFAFVACLAALSPPPPETQMTMPALDAAVKEFDGEVGLAAKNLNTGEEIVVNADARFPTASVIKTAVMLEAWHQAAEGALTLETTLVLRDADKVGGSGVLNGLSDGLALPVRDLVHLMIVLSDNTATNLLVHRLGTQKINDRLLSYGLRETKIFRPTFRDGRPDVHPELEREFGLGMSTPREMARLMALIADGRAVNAAASAAMLSTLRGQQDRAMIPRQLPAGVQVGNKTGTDSEKLPDAQGRRGAIRVDAAIVTSGPVRYVIAVFVRRGADTSSGVDNEAVRLGARLARLVHDRFAGTQPPK
jgi:beta-lactamase class A